MSKNWDDFLDTYDEDEDTPYQQKKKNKYSKPRWREIENIKEKQRLRREIVDISQYEF